MQKFPKNKTQGFTLVETLIAISIFSMSLLGLMVVLASSITNTTYAKEKIIGTYLAQEGIEYVRNIRDTDVLYDATSAQHGWDTFRTGMTPCAVGNECGFNNKIIPRSVFLCTSESSHCKLYLSNGNYNDSASVGVDSGFVRRIWITTTSTDQVRIFSSVSWNQGSGVVNVTFAEDLFNWIE